MNGFQEQKLQVSWHEFESRNQSSKAHQEMLNKTMENINKISIWVPP